MWQSYYWNISSVSVVANFVAPGASEAIQFADQVTIKLIKDISSVLPKLYKSFHVAAISESLVPALSLLMVNFDLNLKASESVIMSSGTSLQYCHKLPCVSE